MSTTHGHGHAHSHLNPHALMRSLSFSNSSSSLSSHHPHLPDPSMDVNQKDDNGTTALHRAVARNDLRLVLRLLDLPQINVNEKDTESGWTALHRALYLGHLRIALALLQHKNINIALEDKDRNTPFDVCHATLPVFLKKGPCPGDSLHTWGSNSNFTLGHNDGDDRKMPELVRFPYRTSAITFPRARAAKSTLYQLSMGKFHTVVATSEAGQSAKVWGFGTSGRLGLDRKMQASPFPIMGISGTIVTTALGRDHTVLVTSKGEVFTLGNNKFGQLGYPVEVPPNGQDPIQYSPKRVQLNIAKLFVRGAAASKWHTVIHTEAELYTFGFNYGQLGYERKGDIQLGPRKVASMPPGLIMQVAASDNATACLMSSNDVLVFYKYAYHKVSFSLFPYPDGFSELNYPRVVNENRPRKISCSENKFGMMTGWGDIHVWSYPEVDSSITLGSLPSNHTVPFSSIAMPDRPRRVWTYGGDRTQAIDFALGQNGSVILLTKGGHVYIGTNKGASLGRNVKWQRVPHLDKIVQVHANPSGAWAAIRSDPTLTPVLIRPGSLGADLEQSLSQFHIYQDNEKNQGESVEVMADIEDDEDDDEDKVVPNPWKINTRGWQDIEWSWDHDLIPLLDSSTRTGNFDKSVSGSHLFDVELQAGKRTIGAHRIILAARSAVLRRCFVESPRQKTKVGSLVSVIPATEHDGTGRPLYTIILDVEFTTAVLLLQFLYSDRFDPIWDALDLPKAKKQDFGKVRQQLYHLALELALPTLQAALQYSFTHICSASLSNNFAKVIESPTLFAGLFDMKLLLRSNDHLLANQMVLGHRSPFFNAMLVRTSEWTRDRQDIRRLPVKHTGLVDPNRRILEVNMDHMDLEAMTLVMRYIYTDCGPEMFNDTEKEEMDDLLQLVISVLKIADELLMDRLKEICEQVLGEQVRAKTVVSFLEIALMYAADALKKTCVDYLCDNLEMVLDQRWLDDVDEEILLLLESALNKKQDSFMPFVRSGGYLPDKEAVEDMQKKIALDGTEYYRPLTPLFRNESAPMFPPGQQQRRKSSVQQPQNTTILSPSLPSPTASTPPSRPAVATRTHSAEVVRVDRSSPSTGETHSHWPTLSASGTPTSEARDILQLPSRKTSWAPVSSQADRSRDSIENIAEGPMNSQPTQAGGGGGEEGGGSTSIASKPSLREILEQEQRHGPVLSHGSAGISTGVKAPKLSQKERRRLLQQQLQPEVSSSSQESAIAPSPTAWSRVTPGGATDNTRMEQRKSAGISSNGGFSEVEIISGSPIGTPSLLDIQQGNLALLHAQPKEVPRVAMATSKPVKETLRPSGVERAFTEAPWRLDAIPEPLRAVTRHQTQMYPKSEGAGGSNSGSDPSFLTSPSSTFDFPALNQNQTQHQDRNSLTRGPNVSLSSFESTGPISTATALSASGMSALIGPVSSSTSTSSTSSTSTLSSFAIIQNQQLRDRNMLLKARHQKKSLYQIQIEELALLQIRQRHLSSRAHTRVAEGTGEWFQCDLG